MSDPDAMPDPIDKAYVEAEAVLSDEAARTARRARVLAAVARKGGPDAAAPPAARIRAWRPGGWLVAACVSGLALVIAIQLYRPSTSLSPTKRSAAVPAAPAAATKGTPAPPASLAAQAPALATKAAPRAARSNAEPPPVGVASAPAPPSPAPSAAGPTPWPSPKAESAAPPPPLADDASERAAPVQAANQPPRASAGARNAENVTEVVVTAEKRESRRRSLPAAISAFIGRDRHDPGAQLRTAAAAGRTTDVERLLEHGAPVDSPDADGDTALMKSIQADRPAAAALLLRNGASLDQTNHAGESARDMARAKGDPELNQAIGLSP